MGHADYKGLQHDYKAWHDPKETGAAGHIIGKAFYWFYKGTFWVAAFAGATVFDTLRMRTPNAEFFHWKRAASMWLGLLGFLLLATGWPGYYLLMILGLALAFMPFGSLALAGLANLPLPLLNALLGVFVPSFEPRLKLMGNLLGLDGRGEELAALANTNLAGVPLAEWYNRLDLGSMLIPVILTLTAAVKYARLARAKDFSEGDECEGRSWSLAEILWLGFAGLLVLGLPGAPLGLWVCISLIGWTWFGETKNGGSGTPEHEVTSGASFDQSDWSADLDEPPAPAPTPVPAGIPADLAPSLRQLEDAERARKQTPPPTEPKRRTDYDE